MEKLDIGNWNTPASSYKEEQSGNYRLRRSECQTGLRGVLDIDSFIYYDTPNTISIVHLEEFRNGEWYDWMVDDPNNYVAMVRYARDSSGDVLTAGLGLGLVAHHLVQNDKVKSVTIVERNQDVCNLTSKYLPKDVRLVQDDFWDFIRDSDIVFDTIIADIWASRNIFEQQEPFLTEVFPAFIKLKAKYPKAKIIFHGYPIISDMEQIKVRKVYERR